VPEQGPEHISRLLPRMLLDIQNRGQLAAGMTSYNPKRDQLIDTHKDVGSVTEVFRLAHRGDCERLMQEYSGRAAIGMSAMPRAARTTAAMPSRSSGTT